MGQILFFSFAGLVGVFYAVCAVCEWREIVNGRR